MVLALAAGALALLAFQSPAAMWTNAAGEAFEADALELDGRTAVFQRPGGEKIRMPVFSLALEDQRRLKELFNGPEIPAPLQQAYAYASEQISRARLLFEEGHLTDQEYASRRAGLIQTFKKSCAEQSFAEKSEEVQQLSERLLTQ